LKLFKINLELARDRLMHRGMENEQVSDSNSNATVPGVPAAIAAKVRGGAKQPREPRHNTSFNVEELSVPARDELLRRCAATGGNLKRTVLAMLTEHMLLTAGADISAGTCSSVDTSTQSAAPVVASTNEPTKAGDGV
jgi:hypothetical protein